MTKEQLQELGLDDTQIKEVFKLNGLAVNNAKGDAEQVVSELENTKALLDKANGKIQEFSTLDVDAIKQEAQKYKEAYEQAKSEAQQEIEAIKYDNALKEHIGKYQFASDRVKNSIYADIKDKGFKYENNQFLGVDDYFAQLKEQEPESFATVDAEPQAKFLRPAKNQDIKKDTVSIAELAKKVNIRK